MKAIDRTTMFITIINDGNNKKNATSSNDAKIIIRFMARTVLIKYFLSGVLFALREAKSNINNMKILITINAVNVYNAMFFILNAEETTIAIDSSVSSITSTCKASRESFPKGFDKI